MDVLTFTLYDTIAYFVPGTIVALALALLAKLDLKNLTPAFPEIVLVIAALAVIYTTGHVLHAIANLTIDRLPSGGYPPHDYFPAKFEKDFQEPFRTLLYRQIVNSFHVQDAQQPDQTMAFTDIELINNTVKNAYWACYVFIAQTRSSPLAQIFNGICGLYRGLCVGSFVIAFAYLVGVFLYNNILLLGIVFVALGIGWLFLNRVGRFKDYLTKTVYSDFLSISYELPSNKREH